ncbi:hypothetical protein HDU77_005527 [Chytriomyces hyalinus]|nr:hypothetical protein HDU77_005527 [Chytriomyces hyalinus]
MRYTVPAVQQSKPTAPIHPTTMELVAADKRNNNNMDRFILPKGMSKTEAVARNKLAHTAKLILKQVEYNPFLKQSRFVLSALDASEVQFVKRLPYMLKYYPKLTDPVDSPDDIFHFLRCVPDAEYMSMLNQNSWKGSYSIEPEGIKNVTAFMQRHITLELHQKLLAEFKFPDHFKSPVYDTCYGCPSKKPYWGCLSEKSRQFINLSEKSRQFIKDLANSDGTYAGNLSVS